MLLIYLIYFITRTNYETNLNRKFVNKIKIRDRKTDTVS